MTRECCRTPTMCNLPARPVFHKDRRPRLPATVTGDVQDLEFAAELNDHNLLQRLRSGDETAFDAIFRAHYAALVGLAERILRQRAIAEEVVQDVLAEVWRRRQEIVLSESFRAYLYRATRNRALNHIRHEKVVERSAVYQSRDPAPPRGLAVAAEREIDAAVQRAVQSLPDRCREVFVLSRGHGLRYTEIATTLGISIKTVEAQMGRALRTLRRELSAWLPDPADEPTAE